LNIISSGASHWVSFVVCLRSFGVFDGAFVVASSSFTALLARKGARPVSTVFCHQRRGNPRHTSSSAGGEARGRSRRHARKTSRRIWQAAWATHVAGTESGRKRATGGP